MNNSRFRYTLKIILYGFPILAMGVFIPIIFGQSNLSILGSYIAVPIFVAPIFYKKYRKKLFICSNSKKIYSDIEFLLLLTFYSSFFIISVILLAINDIRPYEYYFVIVLMAICVLFEIIFFDLSKKYVIILLQLMFLSLNIVWGVTLKYYYFIGRTDPLVHTWYIDNLINYGYVTNIFDVYQQFPLWHIMVAISYMVLNLSIPIYKMMFFVNGLIFSFFVPVIYVISMKIFKDKMLALISVMFALFNPDILFYGMTSLPRSVVSFFEMLLILLLLDLRSSKKILVAILTLIMILYHTVSMLFIISILLLVHILKRLYNVEDRPTFLTTNYFLFTIVAMLVYWGFFANNLFEIIVSSVFHPATAGIITKSILYNPKIELFNYLQYSILLFFVIVGVLRGLESKRFCGFEKIFCILGLLLTSVAIPGPVMLLNKLSSNFDFQRFSEYSLMIIGIIGSVGLTEIYSNVEKKLKILFTILFIIMILLSISNDFDASDNPLVKRTFYTFYLSEEEVVSFNHISNIANGFVMSDYITKRYLESSHYNLKSHFLEIDLENKFLRNNNSDIILIRYKELNKRPLKFFLSTTGKFEEHPSETINSEDYYFRDSSLWKDIEKYNKIYDIGGVSGFN